MTTFLLTALLLGLTVVWGATFAVIKDAVASCGVVSFLAVRFLIASICLAPFGLRKVTAESLLAGGAIGAILAAGYLFQTFGLCSTSATHSGLITGLFVVFAPLLNRAIFGVRTPLAVWGAIAVSLLGLALLTGAGPTVPTRGDLLTLGAAASFALQIVLLGRYSRRMDSAALATTQVVATAAVFLAAWPMVEPLALPPPQVWPALILTGVVATAGGFIVQTLAQKRISPTRAAMIFTLESVFAVLFGYLVAGDRLTGVQFAGAVLMIAAVGLAEVVPSLLALGRGGEEQEEALSPQET